MVDPTHDPDESVDATLDAGRLARRSRWTHLLWFGGVLLVVVFVALHLTGVLGPGGH